MSRSGNAIRSDLLNWIMSDYLCMRLPVASHLNQCIVLVGVVSHCF